MTAGAPTVSIRSFQDILDHGYTVYVAGGTVYETLLTEAMEGTVSAEVARTSLQILKANAGTIRKAMQLDLIMQVKPSLIFQGST